jgi:hypothetical protein
MVQRKKKTTMDRIKEVRVVTMYIANRRNISKFNCCSSFQLSLYLESEVIRNRLLAIYSPLPAIWYDIQTSFTELYKHRLHFLACNLNQNSDCHALERHNDYGTKN